MFDSDINRERKRLGRLEKYEIRDPRFLMECKGCGKVDYCNFAMNICNTCYKLTTGDDIDWDDARVRDIHYNIYRWYPSGYDRDGKIGFWRHLFRKR